MKRLILFLFIPIIFGCGNKQIEILAEETMVNARTSITIAEKHGARDVAVNEISAAEEMLTNAETAHSTGDVERAYRLALRSYLHARIATEKSIASQHEENVTEAQALLDYGQKLTEEVLEKLDTLKAELSNMKK
ncbi:DUF4398 domain-containing protein [Candidatus Poribacteria bacterium]|nr:DUF4398 domain-containing protein [Candidatus Poribacteria bacterium]